MTFIEYFNKLRAGNTVRDLQNAAYESIIDTLMVKDLKGQDKCRHIGEYDTESVIMPHILPGCIYMFIYNPTTKYEYIDGSDIFYFEDRMPLVLITRVNGQVIQGINMNLCPPALRALIINVFYTMDTAFFEDTAERRLVNDALPISKKITEFITQPGMQGKLLNGIKQAVSLDSYSYIFRSYAVNKIKRIRMLEPWQWQYVPFLNYKGNSLVKQDQLDRIYKATKMDRLL